MTPETASLQAAVNALHNSLAGWSTCRDSSKLSLSFSLSPPSFPVFPVIPFQMLPDLKADNQRLKDENGALIRVISKLSK